MKELEIHTESLGGGAFAPFGEVIDVQSSPPIFQGVGLRSWRLGYEAEGKTELMVIEYDEIPMAVDRLERHHRVSQCFIPISSRPMIMVVAPQTGAEPPEPAAVRAFLVPGDKGILLWRGIWHSLNRFPVGGSGVFALLTTAETQAELEAEKHGGPTPHLTDVYDYAADGITFRLIPTFADAESLGILKSGEL